jgi:hypothetical protein
MFSIKIVVVRSSVFSQVAEKLIRENAVVGKVSFEKSARLHE